jgi:hypothetical protein
MQTLFIQIQSWSLCSGRSKSVLLAGRDLSCRDSYGAGDEHRSRITKGKPDLDPREQIFYGEFDGRRRKLVLVKIIGE